MDLSELIDFADKATEEIAKYSMTFTLSPERLKVEGLCIESLDWAFVKYGLDDIEQVPDDTRGIYAFIVRQPSNVLPPHHYIFYIGIAGRQSNRSIRARYRDYLRPRALMKRSPLVRRMVAYWHTNLFFYFAPIPDEIDSDGLENLERILNGALMPPCSEGDLEVSLKQKRKAFR